MVAPQMLLRNASMAQIYGQRSGIRNGGHPKWGKKSAAKDSGGEPRAGLTH